MAPDVVAHSDLLGHSVRTDAWTGQGRSSYEMAWGALDEGRFEDADVLGRLTVQEAQEAFDLYRLWLVRIPSVLIERGVRASLVEGERARIGAVLGPIDLDEGWARYRRLIERFSAACGQQAAGTAAGALEDARHAWNEAHDRAGDELCALFAVAARHLGESSIGPLWDVLLDAHYGALRDKYDPATTPWSASLERLALDIFEATRGHLTGPQRNGSFEITEEPERWVMRFAPCGSGGRTYAADSGPQRLAEREPELDQGFTTEEHDWAWNTKGVCLYCVHCCQLQQRAPIDRVGIPLRVVDPPVRGDAGEPAVCTWSMYKDPALLPAEAFTTVGKPVPDWLENRPERETK